MSTTGASMSTSASTGTGGGIPAITTVFTILLENHDYNEIVGSANAPHINALIAANGLATNYFDSGTHPSLPNYLYLVSGDTQYPGFLDADPTQGPYFPAAGDNLGNQLQGAGVQWRSYQESAGGNCVLSDNGDYAPKHDPFLYFSNIQGNAAVCQAANVDLSKFSADLAGGQYRYMWITPNLVSDGHDPVDFFGNATDPVASLTTSDTWLNTMITEIQASAVYQQGGVIFITWDEAEGRNGDDKDKVPMIIVSPFIKSAGYTSSVHYTHASYLATIEDIFGLPRLGDAVGAPTMFEFLQ